MKISGKIDDFIELDELSSNSCFIFSEIEPSSLTILWFQSNDNILIVDGEEHIFNKNQIAFFTEFHKVKVVRKGVTNFLRFNRPFFCIIDHDSEVSCKGILFFGASQLPVISIPNDQIEHFNTLWQMFKIEMTSQDNLQIGMLQMMLKRYLILCTRLYKKQHQYSDIKKENDIIREFNFLVEQYFNTKHTVAEYADLLHKSPKTISNIFSKIGTKTPLSYIQDRKTLEAKRLLIKTDIPVQEIAYSIGFNDIQTFSRFFKKQTGLSPSKFRTNSLLG